MFRKYLGLILGFATIAAGYALLAGGDITVAPLLLVLGYCILVPLFLLRSFLRGKGE